MVHKKVKKRSILNLINLPKYAKPDTVTSEHVMFPNMNTGKKFEETGITVAML